MKYLPRLALLATSLLLPSFVPAVLCAADSGSPIMAAPPASGPVAVSDNAEIDRLKLQLSTATEQLALSQDQLAKFNQQLADFGDAAKRLQMAQAALDSKDREIAGLRAAAAATPVATPAEAQKALEQLKAQLADALQAAAKMQADLATLTAANQKLASDNADLQKTAATSGQVAATQAAADQKLLGDLQKQLADAQTAAMIAAQAAQTDHAALLAQLEDAKKGTAGPDAEKQKLAKDLADQQRTAAEQQRTIDELNAHLAAQPAAVAQTGMDLAATRDQLQKANDALKSLAAERDTLKGQAADQQSQIAQLTARLAAAPSSPGSAPSTTDGATSDTQKQLAETQDKLDAALRSFTVQSDKIDQLNKTLADLENERAATADKLKVAEADAEASKKTAAERADALARAQQGFDAQRAAMAPTAEETAGLREQLRLAKDAAIAKTAENQTLTAENQALAARVVSNPPPAPVATIPSPAETHSVTAAASPAPKEPAAGPQHHVVVAGDSLSKISLKYYGTAARWSEIYEANRDVMKDPNSLKVGEELVIP